MNSLDYQLGGVIKQEGRPMAYYSRKLIAAEKNYTTIEKECWAIVEILKYFCTVLLGSYCITVFTDHKNLTHEMTKFATKQVILCWQLQLEVYGAKFLYKKREENVLTDALSRVPCQPEGVCTTPI